MTVDELIELFLKLPPEERAKPAQVRYRTLTHAWLGDVKGIALTSSGVAIEYAD